MGVVVFAYHNMGCMGLRVLLRRGVKVEAVFTYTDRAGEKCWFGSVEKTAREHRLPVFLDADLRHPYWTDYVGRTAPDVIFSFYYRDLIPGRLLAKARHGAVNLHGSLLPRYRGRCPVNWQLVYGEKKSGVTIHHMEEKADTGDIIAQRAVVVDDEDTAATLFGKLERAAEALLEENLDAIVRGTAPRIKQDERQATVFGGRGPEDGRIRPEMDRRQVHNLVRAVSDPYPGAFVEENGKKIIFWRTAVPPAGNGAAAEGPAGKTFFRNGELYYQASDGPLRVLEWKEESQSA